MFRDSKGRIWVSGYTRGISMFDGSKWQSFSLSNGLASNAYAKFYEDSEGNIWVIHNTEACISKFSKKGIKTYTFPYKYYIYLFLTEKKTPALLMHNSNSWSISVYNQVLDTFELTDQNFTLKDAFYMGNNLRKDIYLSDTKSIYRVNSHGITKPDTVFQSDKEIQQIAYFDSPDLYFTRNNGKIFRHTPGKKELINPTTLTSAYGPPLKINPRFQVINFDHDYGRYYIIWSLAEKHNYLLQEFAISNNRLVSSLNYHSYYLPKVCTKDAAGNYWVGTESNVQKILAYQYFIPVTADNYMNETWSLTQAKNGNLWMASYGSGLRVFDGHSLKKPPTGFSSFDQALFDDMAIQCDDGSMLFNLESNTTDDKNILSSGIVRVKGRKWEFIPSDRPGMFFGRDRKGRLMRGTFVTGLIVYKDDTDLSPNNLYLQIDTTKGLAAGNVMSSIQDRYGRYWMGRGSQGLSMYDLSKNKTINWLNRDDIKNPSVASIEEDIHGNLWFGCFDGLRFFKNNSKIDQGFSLNNHCIKIGKEYLGESLVFFTKLMDDSTLLVGNTIGYFLIDLNAFYKNKKNYCEFKGIFNQEYYNYSGGAAIQNGVFRSADGCYWMLTDNGIVRHDPAKYVYSKTERTVGIDSIRAGGKLYTEGFKNIVMGYRSPHITFYFSSPTDSLLYDNLFYQYRLNNGPWSNLTRDGYANFSELNAGHYTFSVRTVVEGHRSDVKTISFLINPPWWMKWQVWLATLILILGVGLFFYQKQKKIHHQQLMLSQKETEVEIINKEKNLLRVEAIVNQLNPHFINNVLQWLQIRVDDDNEAVKVIGRLAQNINTVFRNSRMKISFHTLENELQLASNYLYIQKVRFGDLLKLDIVDLNTVEELKGIMVPIMMIQIHVENAVEHGIRNNEDGFGTVTIHVEDEGDFIRIIVRDDGVGREAASRLGSKGTQNGVNMLSELAKIYNKNNELLISQQYRDHIFTHPDGRGYGTEVVIRIPKKYNYVV